MSKPALNQLVCCDNLNASHSAKPHVIRKARGGFEAGPFDGDLMQASSLVEAQLQTDSENIKPGMQEEVTCSDTAATLPLMSQDNTEPASLASSGTRLRVNFESRFQREHQARLRAETKLRQLQTEFAVLAKRTELAALDSSAAEYARLLALEAAERHAMASQTARVEAERKLKAEQDAAELIKSQAEADRNAWQHQEQANVLLRKAEQKARERLASEAMASKAAAFKLQTERELAELAEQTAYAKLQIAHEAELKLRAETKELALINDRLADMRRARSISGQHAGAETEAAAATARKINEQAAQMQRDEENTEIRVYY